MHITVAVVCLLSQMNGATPWIAIAISAVVVLVRLQRSTGVRRPAGRPAGKGNARNAPIINPRHPVILPPTEVSASQAATPEAHGGIYAVRELMGPPPRQFASNLTAYLRVDPPPWLKKKEAVKGVWADELSLAFRNQERIRREGKAVWAAIVQANMNLFKMGPVDAPASAIFSEDPWFDRRPDELIAIARQCGSLKGTDPLDPDAAAMARMLTNEMMRGMRLKVPMSFTGGRKVYHSSIMMHRKHLPKGFLGGGLFPVWVDPDKTTGSLLLIPAAYWPASLTAFWDQNRPSST